MHELLEILLPKFITILSFAAAALLVLGFVIATTKWVKAGWIDKSESALEEYRHAIGRTILIGLEVLLAATIIKTLTVTPSLEEFGLLVMMVAIRTAIGWTTSLEVNACWPWQKPKGSQKP